MSFSSPISLLDENTEPDRGFLLTSGKTFQSQSSPILNSVLQVSQRDNICQNSSPKKKKKRVTEMADNTEPTGSMAEQLEERTSKKSPSQSPKAQTADSSVWEALRELDECERWVERSQVVTTQDHHDYTQYANEFIEDLIQKIPNSSEPVTATGESAPPEEKSSNASVENTATPVEGSQVTQETESEANKVPEKEDAPSQEPSVENLPSQPSTETNTTQIPPVTGESSAENAVESSPCDNLDEKLNALIPTNSKQEVTEDVKVLPDTNSSDKDIKQELTSESPLQKILLLDFSPCKPEKQVQRSQVNDRQHEIPILDFSPGFPQHPGTEGETTSSEGTPPEESRDVQFLFAEETAILQSKDPADETIKDTQDNIEQKVSEEKTTELEPVVQEVSTVDTHAQQYGSVIGGQPEEPPKETDTSAPTELTQATSEESPVNAPKDSDICPTEPIQDTDKEAELLKDTKETDKEENQEVANSAVEVEPSQPLDDTVEGLQESSTGQDTEEGSSIVETPQLTDTHLSTEPQVDQEVPQEVVDSKLPQPSEESEPVQVENTELLQPEVGVSEVKQEKEAAKETTKVEPEAQSVENTELLQPEVGLSAVKPEKEEDKETPKEDLEARQVENPELLQPEVDVSEVKLGQEENKETPKGSLEAQQVENTEHVQPEVDLSEVKQEQKEDTEATIVEPEPEQVGNTEILQPEVGPSEVKPDQEENKETTKVDSQVETSVDNKQPTPETDKSELDKQGEQTISLPTNEEKPKQHKRLLPATPLQKKIKAKPKFKPAAEGNFGIEIFAPAKKPQPKGIEDLDIQIFAPPQKKSPEQTQDLLLLTSSKENLPPVNKSSSENLCEEKRNVSEQPSLIDDIPIQTVAPKTKSIYDMDENEIGNPFASSNKMTDSPVKKAEFDFDNVTDPFASSGKMSSSPRAGRTSMKPPTEENGDANAVDLGDFPNTKPEREAFKPATEVLFDIDPLMPEPIFIMDEDFRPAGEALAQECLTSIEEPTESDGEEEFFLASEAFNPSDPNAFDIDFLEKAGGGGQSDFAESALGRQSLYVKFDPLVKGASPPIAQAGAAIKPVLPTLGETSMEGEDLLQMSTPPSAGSLRQNHLLNSVKRSDEKRPTPDKGVDKLLEFSPSGEPVTEKDTPPQRRRVPESPEAEDGIVQPLLYTQLDLNEALKRAREEYTREDYRGGTLAEKKDNEQKRMEQQLDELQQQNTEMRTVVSEYERMIQQMIEDHDKGKNTNKEALTEIQRERDQALEDLSSVESAFSDLHRRFEKLKMAVEGYKKNEDILKKCVADYQAKLKKHEQRYQTLKSHAEEKIESANLEIDKVRKANTAEIAGLQAALKREQMKVQSLERQVEQKTKENEELTSICDELISKMGKS
ncbi:uncharacterized protein LOC144446953 isoform X3 [Glandiceps talaboti]